MWKHPLQLATSLFVKSFGLISLIVLPFSLIECFFITYVNNYVFFYDPESLESLRTDGFITTAFTPFGTLGVLYAVRQRYHGGSCKIQEVLAFVFRNFFPLIGVLIVVQLLIGLGLIALIVPGVYLAGKYFLVAPLVAFDDDRLISLRERSGQLMEGRKTSSIVIAVLFFLGWSLSFFSAFFGMYLFFPEASIWVEAILESIFAVPFAFLTVFTYAVYVDAIGDEGVPDDAPVEGAEGIE